MRYILILALVVFLLAGCGSEARTQPERETAAVAQLDQPAATPQPATSPAPRRPTPTFVPLDNQQGGSGGAGNAVSELAPAAATPAQPAAGRSDAAPELRLEDTAWTGGYRYGGARTYGGRTATWIYGTGTQWTTMRATFDLRRAPREAAELTIMAMDSEDEAKTSIAISVNGAEVFSGPSPFPDDDLPLETGTWAASRFDVDPSLLRAGRNTITISNRSPGGFGRPPFFMLDYAVLRIPQ